MIHPLFADAAAPSANTVWIVILAISALGGNLATIGIWAATRRKQETMISPQPLVIEMQKEFATKKEFEEQRKHCTERHSQLFRGIESVEKGTGSIIERKVEIVRVDVVQVGLKVAGLEKETELQNQRMASMDAKLDRLIERR